MRLALSILKKTSEYRRVRPFFSRPEGRVLINELSEEAMAALVLSAFEDTDRPIVVCAPNLYKAQLLYDRLSVAVGEESLGFFPQDEFITSEMLVASNEFKMERINTIRDILEGTRKIVVTHTAGIVRPMMPREDWRRSELKFETGAEHDVEGLAKRLVEYGYRREYTVEKPGDFSLRGGIFDIFPLNQPRPFRLDFFGDTIEKIKIFDIESQRSTGTVERFAVMPMYEFFYDDEGRRKLLDFIDARTAGAFFSKDALDRIGRDREAIAEHRELDRLSRYIPVLTGVRTTLVDLLDDPLVFFFDHHRVREQFAAMTAETADWYLSTGDYAKMGFEMLFDLHSIRMPSVIAMDQLEHGYDDPFDVIVKIVGRSPERYEGNFDAFFRDIAIKTRNNAVIVVLRTVKTRDNLVAMFEDRDVPFAVVGEHDALVPGKANLVVSERYFDLSIATAGLVVVTESALSRKQPVPKRGRYVSVYQNSRRLYSVNDLKPGDYVVHYDYGIGRFLEIKTMELGATKNDYIHIEYRDGDKLYIPVDAIGQIQKYAGSEGFEPRLNKLGGSDWAKTKQRVREKTKDIAEKLINLYALREHSEGFAFAPDDPMQSEFESDFEYEETPDQLRAILDVKKDMEDGRPMDRLLCGDVGFGKTEVALRAAFKAVLSNKQVAYLAPTTVLSRQHFHTFTNRMEKFGINVRLMNRFVSRKEQTEVIEGLKSGTVDVLIGTHRILSQDVVFKDLGLLVIDEEQRFGVEHKERIKEMKVNVDVLSLSATPIPRTLQMAIMGVKNMSLLETAPENRYPIQTYVLERNETVIKDAIERELSRHGQVFYIYNRIDDIDRIEAIVKRMVPEARIAVAHGQMNKIQLENVVEAFIERETDVLISTTIIETGIDIPNANTLIIHDADRLGLAQLYQIRGRVGRSNRIAYAYLMYKKDKVLTEDAEKRLKVIKEFTELGSGFKIAVRDLSIRGAGDVLGSEQSGFIDSVGVDLYMRILQEEIRHQQGAPEPERPAKVKATVSKYIDGAYVDDDFVKMEMHGKIGAVKTRADIEELLDEFTDRFGSFEPDLEIYMYEKLFEHLSERAGVEKVLETKTNVTLVISEEGSAKMSGVKVFETGNEVSTYFRFAFKNNRIHVVLDTIRLERHWLFTMCRFLELVTA
ncbi:MAG: transcription-repair coupling factor [Candidatus Izemoplasmatales bacterium]